MLLPANSLIEYPGLGIGIPRQVWIWPSMNWPIRLLCHGYCFFLVPKRLFTLHPRCYFLANLSATTPFFLFSFFGVSSLIIIPYARLKIDFNFAWINWLWNGNAITSTLTWIIIGCPIRPATKLRTSPHRSCTCTSGTGWADVNSVAISIDDVPWDTQSRRWACFTSGPNNNF